ncbi:MAG: glyoxylate/hydroxypyruvate reductase A [Caldimonas sp.]|uniref:NAD(P)-dependent oxidoreductase n=1 Tax=Caldimonas manganoxidans TaxID=196015 RepID=UPI000363F412|nr:NAD(P)-dependent oxidoreductase [Caldimonas manganoxidans]GIX25270.1 MAG: glyoxylate/hydroxypyruvate reductase A [Caldimonas sp.]
MKILLLTHPLSAEPYVEALRRLRPHDELTVWSREQPASQWADADVVLGWRFPAGVAEAMSRLRWVCSVAAGVEKLLVPELPASVPVSRIIDPDQALGIAQYVTAMALRFARELPRYEQQQRERLWARHPMAAARHRVCVLGQGATGQAISRMLSACGFVVDGWRRSQGRPLHEALREARIVVCALPLTPETSGLIDRAALAVMPRAAAFINIARGAHVVEEDLLAALRSGHLAFAALDVQVHEPLPPDSPLWDAPNLIITPHIAAQSSVDTIVAQFIEGLEALETGHPLPRLVDRQLGY